MPSQANIKKMKQSIFILKY